MALKLKFRTMFPASVTAASPLMLEKTGLQYAFGFDVDAMRASLDPLYAPISVLDGLPGLSTTLNPGGQDVAGLKKSLTAAGTSTAGSANQSTWYIQADCQATSSAAHYQKNALFAWAFQFDPSDYTSGINRDAVGMAGFGMSHVANGRVWGANFSVGNISGAPSLMTGAEINVQENHAAVTVGATTASSAAFSLVSNGAYNATAGLLIGGANSVGFQDSIIVQTAHSPGKALLVVNGYGAGQTEYFSVGQTGAVFAAGPVTIGASALAAIANGQGEFVGNTTYGLVLTGQGGTADVTIFNKSQILTAYVPTGTTNFQTTGAFVATGASGPVLSANGMGAIYAPSVWGATLAGKGSVYDVQLVGTSGNASFVIPTGTNSAYMPGAAIIDGTLTVGSTIRNNVTLTTGAKTQARYFPMNINGTTVNVLTD